LPWLPFGLRTNERGECEGKLRDVSSQCNKRNNMTMPNSK
jgi:hypothetical protein